MSVKPKRLSVRVEEDLYRQVKIKCAAELRTVEGVLTELLQHWVANHGAPPPPPRPRIIKPPAKEPRGI